MCSDNGPNFVGAEQELINAFNEMDRKKIHGFLQNNSADQTKWKRNTPPASHIGWYVEAPNLFSQRYTSIIAANTHGQK